MSMHMQVLLPCAEAVQTEVLQQMQADLDQLMAGKANGDGDGKGTSPMSAWAKPGAATTRTGSKDGDIFGEAETMELEDAMEAKPASEALRKKKANAKKKRADTPICWSAFA